jgi:hypothetical protein
MIEGNTKNMLPKSPKMEKQMIIKRALLITMAAMILPGIGMAQVLPPGDEVARFPTFVNFTDNNPASITVQNICNNGDPLDQTSDISESTPLDFVAFVVHDMTDASDVQCIVSIANAPSGYTVSFNASTGEDVGGRISPDNCTFTRALLDGDLRFDSQVEGRNLNYCQITMTPKDARVDITKEWVVEGNQGNALDFEAQVSIESTVDFQGSHGCYDSDNYCGYVGFKGPATQTKTVVFDGPGYLGATVYLDETIWESAWESDNSCNGAVRITNGGTSRCTFTNTAYFEGIPTLNQYGMAIMALLMLGVGFIGFRRFV